MDQIPFIHSGMDGLLALADNTAMNIPVQASLWTYVFISLGSLILLILIFINFGSLPSHERCHPIKLHIFQAELSSHAYMPLPPVGS